MGRDREAEPNAGGAVLFVRKDDSNPTRVPLRSTVPPQDGEGDSQS